MISVPKSTLSGPEMIVSVLERAALARRLPWLEPSGVSAGLHLVTWLPPDLDEAAVVAAAARAGVGMDGVTPYRVSHPGPGGLIFGYAAASEQAIAEGVGILARVIGRDRSGRG